MPQFVHVSGIEGRDPIEDFQAINRELENFSQDLAHRPQIVVANKTDNHDLQYNDESPNNIPSLHLPCFSAA